MARAPALDPDVRRAQILAAAREVFARVGYHQAGVSDVIAEAGVARGTFYNYFESKRAAFHAVLSDMMDEAAGAVHPIDITRDIPTQVRENLGRVVRAVMAEDVVRVLFGEAAGIDEEGDEVLRAFYGAALERIERALRTGQALGVVRQGDVFLTARCLLGVIKEPVFQANLFKQPLDPEHLVDELQAFLIGGVLVS